MNREEFRAFVLSRWPRLASRLPAGLELLKHVQPGARPLCGLISDIRAPVWQWLFDRGGSRFLGPEVQDPFVACLVQDRGNSEGFLLMWREGARRFWFSSHYVVFQGSSGDETKRASRELDQAMHRWEQGDETVIFSGDWGWYDPEAAAFERDSRPGEDASFCERDERRMTETLGSFWERYHGPKQALSRSAETAKVCGNWQDSVLKELSTVLGRPRCDELQRRFAKAAEGAPARPYRAPFDDLGESFRDLVAVGWIADDEQVIDYTRGEVGPEWLDRLRGDLLWSQPLPALAPVSCKACKTNPVADLSDSVRHPPGLIFVPCKPWTYVAPGHLVHFIYDHGYLPRPGFMHAVWTAPRVGSLAFAHAMKPHFEPALYAAMRAVWQRRGPIQHDLRVCPYCDMDKWGTHCTYCGLDWTDLKHIVMYGRPVTNEDILALFA